MAFTQVTREKSKLRLALAGPSGAGKTLSALLMAYGITGDWGKIALIDTEHGRAKFYANRSDFETGNISLSGKCLRHILLTSISKWFRRVLKLSVVMVL